MTMIPIEELLEGKPAAQADTPPAPQGSPHAGETEKPADATAQPIPASQAAGAAQQTGDKTNGATPAPDTAKDPQEEVRQARAFQKAAEDERHKRQEIERERDELRRQNAEYQQHVLRSQQQAQRPAPQQRPDFLDPEGTQYLQGQFQTALEQAIAPIHQSFLETKVVQSQEFMRGRHADYDAVETAFLEATDGGNPEHPLYREMQAHPSPASFAYREGKKFKALKEIGDDPDAYRNKLKEDILAELKANETPAAPATQPAAPQTPTVPAPPPSLAMMSSATGRPGAWQGPASLDALLSAPIKHTRL